MTRTVRARRSILWAAVLILAGCSGKRHKPADRWPEWRHAAVDGIALLISSEAD